MRNKFLFQRNESTFPLYFSVSFYDKGQKMSHSLAHILTHYLTLLECKILIGCDCVFFIPIFSMPESVLGKLKAFQYILLVLTKQLCFLIHREECSLCYPPPAAFKPQMPIGQLDVAAMTISLSQNVSAQYSFCVLDISHLQGTFLWPSFPQKQKHRVGIILSNYSGHKWCNYF